MSFPRYPAYRDSGVQWLGEVPAHWPVVALSRVTTARCDGPFGTAIKSEHYKDQGARVIRLQNIRAGLFEGADAAYIDLDYFERELLDHDVVGGDLLIAGLGDAKNQVGRACVAPDDLGPALVKADCFRFRLDKNAASSAFIAMMLCTGASADGGFYATGSTRQRIPLSVTGRRRVTLPPLSEQTAIANFLDRETAKVDALVADYRTLIELLKEKRQAVISHAVTKGLDPTVPMKDSGVEWLGEVPEHWDVMALSRVSSQRCDGPFGTAIKSEHYKDAGARVIRLQNIRANHFDASDAAFLDLDYFERELSSHGVLAGDLLIAGLGDDNNQVGRACVAPEGLGAALVKADCFRFRLSASASPSFVASQLSTEASFDGGYYATGTTRQRIPLSVTGKRRVALPPRDDQELIAQYITEEGKHLGDLLSDAQQAITLLQERRTALICAAVTGKIDVRGLVEQEAA